MTTPVGTSTNDDECIVEQETAIVNGGKKRDRDGDDASFEKDTAKRTKRNTRRVLPSRQNRKNDNLDSNSPGCTSCNSNSKGIDDSHGNENSTTKVIKNDNSLKDSDHKKKDDNANKDNKDTKGDHDTMKIGKKETRKIEHKRVEWLDMDKASDGNKRRSKKTKKDDYDMAWICSECKEAECMIQPEATEFLICDGRCCRIFHYPCAGLSQLPPSEDKWICKDCINGKHQCAFCQEYGVDDEDVFPCKKEKCGLFFHESCLSMHDVEVTMVFSNQKAQRQQHNNMEITPLKEEKVRTEVAEQQKEPIDTTNGEKKTPNMIKVENEEAGKTSSELCETVDDAAPDTHGVPVFTCPAHWCWTCTQKVPEINDDGDEKSRAQDETTTATNSSGSMSSQQSKGNKGRKKKKGARKRKSLTPEQKAFQAKPDSRLYRCLECPIAYHISCIPPTSRFHELALLCHEHSKTNKLPDLDIANSLQGFVEEKIDQQLLKVKGRREKRKISAELMKLRRKRQREELLDTYNKFFLGMKGDSASQQETFLLDYFSDKKLREEEETEEDDSDDDENDDDKTKTDSHKDDWDLRFCLPCDLKDEVHSKPPSYKHVHSLRYDPKNRPKKLRVSSGETCNCKKGCGDDCLNRQLMIECFGAEKGGKQKGATNCNAKAGDKCGNRALSKRQYAKCKPKREGGGKGWGLITVDGIAKAGQLVQEYLGEVIDEAAKESRLKEWAKEHPNDPNFYIMALHGGWYIDARFEANLSRFINHSCDPNCRLVPVNVRGYMRIGIFSTRKIAPGEFLSYDYHFDTRHGDKFVCRCLAKNCRGTMKGGANSGVDDSATNKKKTNKRQLWLQAKLQYELDKKFLDEYNKHHAVVSNVDVLVPSAEQESETVAMGPQDRYRRFAITNRNFLWRNAKQGADFSKRWTRLNPPSSVNKSSSHTGSGTVDRKNNRSSSRGEKNSSTTKTITTKVTPVQKAENTEPVLIKSKREDSTST